MLLLVDTLPQNPVKLTVVPEYCALSAERGRPKGRLRLAAGGRVLGLSTPPLTMISSPHLPSQRPARARAGSSPVLTPWPRLSVRAAPRRADVTAAAAAATLSRPAVGGAHRPMDCWAATPAGAQREQPMRAPLWRRRGAAGSSGRGRCGRLVASRHHAADAAAGGGRGGAPLTRTGGSVDGGRAGGRA